MSFALVRARRALVIAVGCAFLVLAACSSDDDGSPAGDDNVLGPPSCPPPSGFRCCDGDVLGTWICGADGGAVCQGSTRLTPSADCTLPPPIARDAGPTDAASAADAAAEDDAGDADAGDADAGDAADADADASG